MCLLFETIKVKDGKFCQLQYHNQRMNYARKQFFNAKDSIDLASELYIPEKLKNGIYKCKVTYNQTISGCTNEPYIPKNIQSIKLVYNNEINYAYKYLNRDALNLLLTQSYADEIIIVKHGIITDTSYSNVAFYNGANWITPRTPLLYGTKRSYLLDKHILLTADIKPEDLKHFSKLRIINAMLDFEDILEFEIDTIINK
jgi:4-amino-4-deoxychorismate lyase